MKPFIEKYKDFLSESGGASMQRLMCIKSFIYGLVFAFLAVATAIANKMEASKLCVEIFYVLIFAGFSGKLAGKWVEKRQGNCDGQAPNPNQ